MNSSRFITLLLILLYLAAPVPARSAPVEEPSPGEYQVKAAFLYNFFTFVEWPDRPMARADAIRMCVLGALPARQGFDELNDITVTGRKVLVLHVSRSDDLKRCQVLFISSAEERRLSSILETLSSAPILTIGDTPGFAQRGVIINFYLDRKKVRFEINAAAAGKAGLVISSKLLKLAGSVYGGPAGEE